jgi:hypothetical protein
MDALGLRDLIDATALRAVRVTDSMKIHSLETAMLVPTTSPITVSSRHKLRGFVLDRQAERPLRNIVVTLEIEPDDGIIIRLGPLVSDHAGYVAFDVSAYLSIYTPRPKRIAIGALGDPESSQNLGVALDQDRIGCDFLLRVQRSIASTCPPGVNLPSVQNVDPSDWEISPYSFVVKPDTAIGDDGCQIPVPSSLPESEFRFARVVRIPAENDQQVVPVDTRVALDEDDSDKPRQPLHSGYVLEYSQQWVPIGHSIGQLLYSLALAPCESVNIAIIDWQREDTIARSDQVVSRESLIHRQRRDRTIDEAIDATLEENQSGWSLMAGKSQATTGRGAADLTALAGFPLNVAGAIADIFAVGGSVASTSGTRNLTADSMQEIHDKVSQNTVVVRSLSGTVVVQASQAESSVVQTRTVSNHNHCHPLTMQYFEVVRHYRVVTSYVRRRRAALIPYNLITDFDRDTVVRYRTALEFALLDERLQPAFDAVVRLDIGDTAYESADIEEPDETNGGTSTQFFSGTQVFTVDATKVTDTGLLIEPGSTMQISATGQGIKFKSPDYGDGYGPAGAENVVQLPYPGVGLHEYALLAQIGGTFTEVGAGKSFESGQGGWLNLQFNDWKLDDNSGSANVIVTVIRPEPEPQPGEDSGESSHDKGSDEVIEGRLLRHLNGNLGYYNRVIWLIQDPIERRLYLEKALEDHPDLINALADTPIAVSGNYLAFALNTAEDLESQRPEDDRENPPQVSILSLPTHGVFAEAMLGHCNACEVRDVTRFWNWEESPCPPAPTIQGITPGPQGQAPTIEPAALPSPVVQVMQAPAVPDPTGLAAALTLMGRSDIFRDMSGVGELQTLLSGLASGAVSLAQARDMAKAVQDAVKTPSGNGPSGLGASQGPTVAQPNEPDAARQIDKLNAVKYAQNQQLLDDESARRAAEGILGGRLIASADDGIGTAEVEGELPDASVLAGIDTDPRLKESYDKLVSDGWQLRRTNIWFGNSSIDSDARILYIDDDGEPVATTTEWIADAVRKAYQDDDDYRRRAIRDKAMVIFSDSTLTDLEKMAQIYDWAVWFWRYPSDDGDAGELLDDMMLVLTPLEPNGVAVSNYDYYIYSKKGVKAGGSTGFKYAFRDNYNQVTHATAALQASYAFGLAGLAAMQLREDDTSADWRLNNRCFDVAQGLRNKTATHKPKDIGDVLRRELGDATETGPWTGPADGDPAAPMP